MSSFVMRVVVFVAFLVTAMLPTVNASASIDSPQGASKPAWSPDGSKIVYTTCCNFDIWVIEQDGTNPTNLTGIYDSLDEIPVWSPDGEKIYFLSNRAESWDVWEMKADGTEPHNLTREINGAVGLFEVSPDGSQLAFTYQAVSQSDDPKWTLSVAVMDLESKEFTLISPSDEALYSLHSWSPDGSRLAFQKAGQDNDEVLSEVYIFNMETFTIEEQFVGPHEMPVWSPDGTVIALLSSNCSLDFDISILILETLEIQKLTNGCPSIYVPPAWSPDGSSIAFLQATDKGILNTAVSIMNLESQTVVTTSPGERSDTDPAWSPDGQEIAFRSTRDNELGDIWIMSADGTGLRNITNLSEATE